MAMAGGPYTVSGVSGATPAEACAAWATGWNGPPGTLADNGGGVLTCFDVAAATRPVLGAGGASITWADYEASLSSTPPAPSTPASGVQSITCAGTCTLTVTHEIHWPEALTGLTAEKSADYMQMWGLFLAAAVVVLCVKSLYNRFRIDTHEG